MVITGSPGMGSAGGYLLGSGIAGAVWFVVCLYHWFAAGCVSGKSVWPELPGYDHGRFYGAQPASTAQVISCVATGLHGVTDDWFLSAAVTMGSQCCGGHDSLGLVFAAFNIQCAYLALGYVRAAVSEALFSGGLVHDADMGGNLRRGSVCVPTVDRVCRESRLSIGTTKVTKNAK